MRHSVVRRQPGQATSVLTRWRGMGAILAVAFYSLFFSAHLKFQNTPIYVHDGLIFGAQSKTVFMDLASDREDGHGQISALHPAFTLLHQPLAQLFSSGWRALGMNPAQAQKHGVAVLTCLAAGLSVVMVFHTLLWCGCANLRAILLSMIYGASTCVWIMAPLPEVWLFAGLGILGMISITARGHLASPGWQIAVTVYAISTFVGSLIPCLILALTRFAQTRAVTGQFRPQSLLIPLVAVTLSFGLANLQRQIYPTSKPLPKNWQEWSTLGRGWDADRGDQALVMREVFISNIVAPPYVTTKSDQRRQKITVSQPIWSVLDLRRGVSGGWLLILALAFAGLIWRAQIDPFTLGITVVLMWSIVALSWYGAPETLLLHACLWTGVVIIAVGLGLERALNHWQRLVTPLTLFLGVFVSALIIRNWMYLVEVTRIPGQ